MPLIYCLLSVIFANSQQECHFFFLTLCELQGYPDSLMSTKAKMKEVALVDP